MNLAVRRLLFFCFSITALIACDDPNDIGLELQEGNQIGTEFTDTITINTGTVLLSDSVTSFRLNPSLVGYYEDPAVGFQRATTYTEIGVGNSDFNKLENTSTLLLDSLVLTLDYNFIYGNQTSDLTVQVHQLEEKENSATGEAFDSRESYFTRTTLPYKSSPIASGTFSPQILKTKNTNLDSAVVARIRLDKVDKSFAEQLLNQAGKESVTTQQQFNAFIKGFALVSPTSTSASLVSFNLNSTGSALRLYYKTGPEEAQKVHVFPMAGSEVRNFYNVTADRTTTALAPLSGHGSFLPASATGGESYVQTNTQLLTKITFPYLDKFREGEGKRNIIINRAELIVPVKQGSNNVFPSHPSLVLYETDQTNLIRRNADGIPLAIQQEGTFNLNTTSYPATVEYNAKKGYYRLNMTTYVQAVIYEAKKNTGLLLSSGNAGQVAGSQVSERQIVQEPRPFRTIISNTAAEPVKLLIYYSKLN